MGTKFFKTSNIISILALIVLAWSIAGCSRAPIRAGAAQCEITPPVGYEIMHFYRNSIGVHDPLFAKCLYLEDSKGSSVAIICLDLILGEYIACDELRKEIQKKTGIEYSLINFSHNHSSAALGPRGQTKISNDTNSKWNDQTLDAILSIVQEARKRAEPVSLRAGRAPAQAGFNRRLVNKSTGNVYMGVNREGPVVPWVNVLVADSKKTGKPLAVLFEHAAHPVIVPDTSKLISADYPGAAVKRVREVLGDNVIALFGQGCCGNINGFPLRSTHEKADQAGSDLGDAVLRAIGSSSRIKSNSFSVKFTQAMLPSAPLPSEEELVKIARQYSENNIKRIRGLLESGNEPPQRRFDAYAVMFGNEWCLVTMPHEMFCQYELWVDKNAPFKHTMTFAYTNGYQYYIAVDEDLSMGPKGGYEASTWFNDFGLTYPPPAVGCEKIIKDKIASMWLQGAGTNDTDTRIPKQ